MLKFFAGMTIGLSGMLGYLIKQIIILAAFSTLAAPTISSLLSYHVAEHTVFVVAILSELSLIAITAIDSSDSNDELDPHHQPIR